MTWKARKSAAPVARQARKSQSKRAREARLSRLKKPDDMSLDDWQRELRKQFGRDQAFRLANLGDQPFFSEFEVTNPQSGNAYRVRVRGTSAGDNFCSCPDFMTNTLGTCKHIEFTLAALERKRGGAAALRAGFQPVFSEVFVHYGPLREVRFRPGSDCPAELARLAGKYFDDSGVLSSDACARFDRFLDDAAALDAELRCTDDALGFVAEVRDDQRRRQRLAEAFPRGTRSAAFKGLLKVPLYDYQREGALFAARAGRCLIGDEMGLGKTIQALAAAEIMAQQLGVARVLIICPTSLKHQWAREIERFTTRPATVIAGLRPQRERAFAPPAFFKIMNYDTVHADLDLIQAWGPDLVILDEAQRIKNWGTRVARSVKRVQSAYAIVLTGTPLENRLEELVSIVQFVDRFRLGPTFRLLHEHQVRDDHGKVVGYRELDRIGETLAPVLLRRQKDQVLDQLPERIDTNIFVPMTPEQRKHHTENMEIVARVVQKWRRYGFLSEADKTRMMIAMQRMRMSCDSSYLVDHMTDHGTKADEAVTQIDELLERRGTKIVVFSQWTRMHELIERRLKGRDWGYVLFNGSASGPQRKERIDRFRDDPDCRLFLSTDAGGVGLNLQHAHVVFNMDLPWNPAVLEQRIGRVHRLGQKQAVRVINYVAKGTIEEGMLSVLQFKKSLFSGVLDGGDKDVFLGGSRLQKFMESVEAATAAVPAAIPEDAESEAEPVANGRSRKGERKKAPRQIATDDDLAPAAPANDPWTALLEAGMSVLQQLGGSPAEGDKNKGGTAALGALVQRDPKSGESYLKLPVPKPEVIDQALRAFGALLEGLRR